MTEADKVTFFNEAVRLLQVTVRVVEDGARYVCIGILKESDRFIEKGDFVRLRQLQLGYTLPKKIMQKVFIERLRFYVSGENLFTITGYDGIDPEFSRVSVLNTGIDKLIYPFTRSFTLGAQLTF